MDKYILIQSAEFDNNPIYILCAPRMSGKTIALMNYIGYYGIRCDYIYMYRNCVDNAIRYVKNSVEDGLITKMPIVHFVEYKSYGCTIEHKSFDRLIIELDEIDLDDVKTIIHKALNVYKYHQIILVGTPDRFKSILTN